MTDTANLAPLQLQCIEFREYLQGGITRPMPVTEINEVGEPIDVVLKLKCPDSRDGHFEGTSLACELICSIELLRYVESTS